MKVILNTIWRSLICAWFLATSSLVFANTECATIFSLNPASIGDVLGDIQKALGKNIYADKVTDIADPKIAEAIAKSISSLTTFEQINQVTNQVVSYLYPETWLQKVAPTAENRRRTALKEASQALLKNGIIQAIKSSELPAPEKRGLLVSTGKVFLKLLAVWEFLGDFKKELTVNQAKEIILYGTDSLPKRNYWSTYSLQSVRLLLTLSAVTLAIVMEIGHHVVEHVGITGFSDVTAMQLQNQSKSFPADARHQIREDANRQAEAYTLKMFRLRFGRDPMQNELEAIRTSLAKRPK